MTNDEEATAQPAVGTPVDQRVGRLEPKRKGFRFACPLLQEDYKPGDQAPKGYLAWHEWAEVQHKAGLRQKQCGRCGLWRYPQELSGDVLRREAKTARGKAVQQISPVCLKCQLRARHMPPNVNGNRPA